MKLIDWIAIVGALAWTPHLFLLVRQWLTKPRVRVLKNRTAEIGFTTYGPITNLRLAFAVEHKDIVVSGLRLKIRHEDGDERIFSWQGITQQVLKMTMPDSNVMPFEKEQSVLAIKITEKDIEERFIRFQESAYIENLQTYIDKAVKKMAYLKAEEKYEGEKFLREPEMTDLYGFIKHSFSWKPGKYTLTVEVSSPVTFEIVDNEREFTLTPLDVERLSENKDMIEKEYREIVLGKGPDEKGIFWQWINPNLIKLKKSLQTMRTIAPR